jgi:hypothetical protein
MKEPSLLQSQLCSREERWLVKTTSSHIPLTPARPRHKKTMLVAGGLLTILRMVYTGWFEGV